MTTREGDRQAVADAYRALWEALVDEDTAYLSALLDEDFAIIHATGDRQLKDEWLDDIEAGEVRYHSVEQQTVEVQLQGDEAALVARCTADIATDDLRELRQLYVTVDYERRHDEWVAVRATVTAP